MTPDQAFRARLHAQLIESSGASLASHPERWMDVDRLVEELRTDCRQVANDDGFWNRLTTCLFELRPAGTEPAKSPGSGTVPLASDTRTVLPGTVDLSVADDLRDFAQGRYEILRHIGVGGMGQVFLAEQLDTGRKVAIKTVRSSTAESMEAALRFFRQEVLAAARLNHPNIATVYEADTRSDQVFLVMEFVEGPSLRTQIANEGAMSPRSTVKILRSVARGLIHAHSEGIIHRDLKPENIMLAPHATGFVPKILDFGIAIMDRFDADGFETGVARPMGTPAYMAPEQIRGEQLDERVDLYSLALMGHEMIEGRHPFRARSVPELMELHLNQDPSELVSLRGTSYESLGRTLSRGLRKNRDERHSSVSDFLEELPG